MPSMTTGAPDCSASAIGSHGKSAVVGTIGCWVANCARAGRLNQSDCHQPARQPAGVDLESAGGVPGKCQECQMHSQAKAEQRTRGDQRADQHGGGQNDAGRAKTQEPGRRQHALPARSIRRSSSAITQATTPRTTGTTRARSAG